MLVWKLFYIYGSFGWRLVKSYGYADGGSTIEGLKEAMMILYLLYPYKLINRTFEIIRPISWHCMLPDFLVVLQPLRCRILFLPKLNTDLSLYVCLETILYLSFVWLETG